MNLVLQMVQLRVVTQGPRRSCVDRWWHLFLRWVILVIAFWVLNVSWLLPASVLISIVWVMTITITWLELIVYLVIGSSPRSVSCIIIRTSTWSRVWNWCSSCVFDPILGVTWWLIYRAPINSILLVIIPLELTYTCKLFIWLWLEVRVLRSWFRLCVRFSRQRRGICWRLGTVVDIICASSLTRWGILEWFVNVFWVRSGINLAWPNVLSVLRFTIRSHVVLSNCNIRWMGSWLCLSLYSSHVSVVLRRFLVDTLILHLWLISRIAWRRNHVWSSWRF